MSEAYTEKDQKIWEALQQVSNAGFSREQELAITKLCELVIGREIKPPPSRYERSKLSDHCIKLMENTAAIAQSYYERPEAAFIYTNYMDSIGGTTGVWMFLMAAAHVLEDVSTGMGVVCWDESGIDYIECIDSYVNQIVAYTIENRIFPSENILESLAEKVINESRQQQSGIPGSTTAPAASILHGKTKQQK